MYETCFLNVGVRSGAVRTVLRAARCVKDTGCCEKAWRPIERAREVRKCIVRFVCRGVVRGREVVFGLGLSSRYDEDRAEVRVVERQINPSEIPNPNLLNKL